MLDRFTDRARRVMSMAKEEAIALSSTKVGTEHLLLALAKEEGIASEALQSLDISYDDVMDQIKEAAGAATTKPATGSPAVDASSASSSADSSADDAPASDGDGAHRAVGLDHTQCLVHDCPPHLRGLAPLEHVVVGAMRPACHAARRGNVPARAEVHALLGDAAERLHELLDHPLQLVGVDGIGGLVGLSRSGHRSASRAAAAARRIGDRRRGGLSRGGCAALRRSCGSKAGRNPAASNRKLL